MENGIMASVLSHGCGSVTGLTSWSCSLRPTTLKVVLMKWW